MNRSAMCSEEEKTRFLMVKAVLILCMFVSGFGFGLFLYFLIGYGLAIALDRKLIMIDGTIPPYVGIVCIAVLILCIFGLKYITELEKGICEKI